MKVLLINDKVETYNDWFDNFNEWILDNDVDIKFMQAEDSGQVQPFYNHLYIYFEIDDSYADFFLLTWGEYVDHIEYSNGDENVIK